MVSKRFTVACAAVAAIALVGKDDNDHGDENLAVMVCKVIIVAMATDALVGRLFRLLSFSYSGSEFETTEDDDDDDDETPSGGLYALRTSSSSSNSLKQSPLEARAPRVNKEPDDDDETPSPQIRWTKPELGWVKLNVDGSCDHISRPRSAGCGGVVRNSSGKWLLGFAQKLEPSFNDHQSEIEAILKGLELASDMNVEKLVVESDREPAVSKVKKGLGGRTSHPQFNIINRIRQLCSDPKWEVKVVHVPRKANRVANKLAKDSRGLLSMNLCKYPYPPANFDTLIEEDAKACLSYY